MLIPTHNYILYIICNIIIYNDVLFELFDCVIVYKISDLYGLGGADEDFADEACPFSEDIGATEDFGTC